MEKALKSTDKAWNNFEQLLKNNETNIENMRKHRKST